MSDSDDRVSVELAEILGRAADLMEMAQFDEDEKIKSVDAIRKLRLMGNNASADELQAKHRT